MHKVDLHELKEIIKEYGARDTLQGLIEVLKEVADDYSDMGLKDQAHEAAELAELLVSVHTVTEA